MPKLLTGLKISEVSAVDAAAGENCKILLRKRDQDVVGKATAALKESVDSIIACDDDDEVKRAALVETFGQFESYLDRNVAGGKALSKGPLERAERERREKFEKIFAGKADDADAADVAKKAHGHRGHHQFVGALFAHLHDRLERERRRHGFEKLGKETPPMKSYERWHDIVKSHGVDGIVEIAKNITDTQNARGVTEGEWVKLIDSAARVAHPELGALAFEKVFAHNSVLAKAIAVIKAGLAEQLLNGGLPVHVVGGADARDVDNASAVMEAYDELVRIGRERWGHLSPAQQFEKAFEANPELAQKAHRRPTAPSGGAYAFPR
jgi:hypothetical protein